MDRFNALGRGFQIMLGAGVLLFIDLFLPWQAYSGPFKAEIEAAGGDTSRTAFHGLGGWLLGLLTLVLIAWLVAKMLDVAVPVPFSDTLIAAGLAVLIVVIAVLKALVDDYSGWAAWVGVILSIAILVGAWLQVQATGGMDALRTQLPSMPAASGAAGSAGTTTAAPPPMTEPMAETPPQPSSAPADTAAPAPPPPPAAPPPMGEPAAPAEATPAEERPSSASGIEPSTESSEETR